MSENKTVTVNGISGENLKNYIEKIERLEEEKAGIAADIKDVYSAAKGSGFDSAIMKEIVKQRKLDKEELEEKETILDLYKRAIGMIE